MKTAHLIPALLLCTMVAYSCRKEDSKPGTRPATNDSTYVDNDSTRELQEVIQLNYMWLREHRLREIVHLTFDQETKNEVDTTSKIFALQMVSPTSIQLPSGRIAAYYRMVDSTIEYRYLSPDGNAWLRLQKSGKVYEMIDIYDTLTTTAANKTTITTDHYWVDY